MGANTFVTITTRFMLRVHEKTNDIRSRHQLACNNITYQLPNSLKEKIKATDTE